MSKEKIFKYSLIGLILLAIIVALTVILWPKAPDNSAGMGLTVDPYSGAFVQPKKTAAEEESTGGISWAEWRTWAMANYLVATGNRASTVISLKIKDIDFEAMTIFLSKVKNRRQQIIPMSRALKEVLLDYLQTWDYKENDYLFPSNTGSQLNIRSFQGAISR